MNDLFPLAGKRIWVAGEHGMVGRAIVRRLATENCEVVSARGRIDLRDQSARVAWMAANPADLIFLAAAKVGGIGANDALPAQFLYDNLMIETNIIEGARRTGVAKLVFLGSSCIYPKHAAQPIREDALLTGPLEPTNQWYALAKIAGLKLCDAYREQFGDDFISAMPTNLYGPWDNFDPETGHALPGMIVKFHRAKMAGAKSVTLWGSGAPRREWLHVDDAAEACLVLLEKSNDSALINIGVGEDLTIKDLAEIVRETV